MDYKNEFLEKDSNLSVHYLDRYISVLGSLEGYDGEGEKHHILPKSIWPEYEDDKWNKRKIPTRWHYLIHWILLKIFRKENLQHKMSFAFNQMSRTLGKRKGVLYEKRRKYISAAVKKANTGRKHSPEIKNACSKRIKDTVIVMDKFGNRFRVDTSDPRYISGELVFHLTGSTHSEETKQKMSDNNGVKGKICCHKDGKIDYFNENEIPDGWEVGWTDEQRKQKSLYFSSTKWYNNGKVNRRIKDGDLIPKGFIRGRLKVGKFQGFVSVNEVMKTAHNKGKKLYTKGNERKFFNGNDHIPEGFIPWINKKK